MDIATLVFRWAHILAAVTAAGGIIFWRFVLLPATSKMSDEDRQNVIDATRAPWARLVMIATFALLVTGLYNAVTNIKAYDYPGQPYHVLVMVKLVLAMVFFYLAARMSGRSEAAGRFRERLPFWLNVLLAVVLGLVLTGGYMKNMTRVAKPTTAEVAQTATISVAPDTATE
jgi:uncharacterized membrane protein